MYENNILVIYPETNIELQDINLEEVTGLDLSNYTEITDKEAISLAQKLPNIKSLNLSGCVGLSIASFYKFNSCFKQLNKVSLANSDIKNDALLLRVSAQFDNVRYYDLSNCPNITDIGIKYFSINSPQVEILDISGNKKITDNSLRYLTDNCKNLKSLNLSGCSELTDMSIVDIGVHLNGNLLSLDISNCNFSDSTLIILKDHCNSLSFLNLSHNNFSTEYFMPYLARLENLEYLNISGIESITDEVVGMISVGMSKLKTLNISDCPLLSSASLCYILMELPELQKLNISNCDITEDFILGLNINNHENLEKLSITGTAITNEVLAKLIILCPNIKDIDISNCQKIDDIGVTALRMQTNDEINITHENSNNISGIYNNVEISTTSIARTNFEPDLHEISH